MAASLTLLAAGGHGSELLICKGAPAGRLTSPHRQILLPDGSPAHLLVTDQHSEAENPACRRLHLPVPAKAVLWTSLVSSEEGKAFGTTLALQGSATGESFQVSEIIDTGEQILQAPREVSTGASSHEPASVDLNPQPGSRPLARSAWVWSAATWANRPEAIWSLQARHGLTAVYLTIPIEGGKVRNPELLAGFVAEARRRHLAVWPVSGDPRDVLAASHPALLERLAAYADYNRKVRPESRLAGVQLDIEPYLLPGYRLAPGAWRERYIATIRKVRAALDPGLALDLVMPVWWGQDRHWGASLLNALAPLDISVTVMNYRTDARALLAGGRAFLDWGSRHGHPVAMALEAGPVPDEERRHYRSDASGELWLVPQGSEALLVLFSTPVSGLPGGRAYRYCHTTLAPGGAISFAGDTVRLEATAHKLLPEWAVWPNFAGIAIHGLDATP